MPRSPGHDLGSLASLAEPVRRRLYDFVVSQQAPVDRDTAAAGAGIARALAAFHLDRLADAGLLEVEYRRRSGRTGPGAGRPAKFYRRAANRDITVSLPPRDYGLAAEILANGVERRPDAADGVLEAARERGARLAAGITPGGVAPPGTTEAPLLQLLAGQGYEPSTEEDGVVRLRNCPFDALVDGHLALTCSMNLALLTGVVDAIGAAELVPESRPEDGYCCVAFVPSAAGAAGRAGRARS